MLLSFCTVLPAQQSDLLQRLNKIEGISGIELLKSDHFKEKYVFKMQQWLNHKDTSDGKFTQRVVLCHAGVNRPTLIITEGYGGAYALYPGYTEELSTLLNTNIVFVEHRFFLESTPEPCNWNFMTGENAANDLHRIRQALGAIYKNKWISSGISKGGMNTLIYRAFFPEDVSFSVPYVAPLNQDVEDGRPAIFLKKVGNKSARKKIARFQQQCLAHRDELSGMMKEFFQNKKMESFLSWEEMVDYSVLEFPFSFWQWGHNPDKIPGKNATAKELFSYLTIVVGPEYWAKETPTSPFFVQAAHELGYYSYDTKSLRKWLKTKSTEGYLKKIFLPEECKNMPFDKSLYNKLYSFLQENDPKMIFIYGEYDPWSAARIPDFKQKQNLKIYIQPKGSHLSRINNMPAVLKDEIIKQIHLWIEN